MSTETTRDLTPAEHAAVLFSAESAVRADAEEVVPLGIVMEEYDRRGVELVRLRQLVHADPNNHADVYRRGHAAGRAERGHEVEALGLIITEQGNEMARMRQVIRDYVGEVENGERFAALARLASDGSEDGA